MTWHGLDAEVQAVQDAEGKCLEIINQLPKPGRLPAAFRVMMSTGKEFGMDMDAVVSFVADLVDEDKNEI